MTGCQFCRTEQNVVTNIPGGDMCNHCKKNLELIREWGFGIPQMRVTKEMHVNESELNERAIKILKERLDKVEKGDVLTFEELRQKLFGDKK